MAADDGHALDDSHFVFDWVFGEGVCAGLLGGGLLIYVQQREGSLATDHSCSTTANNDYTLPAILEECFRRHFQGVSRVVKQLLLTAGHLERGRGYVASFV